VLDCGEPGQLDNENKRRIRTFNEHPQQERRTWFGSRENRWHLLPSPALSG
jgi:hypothetical protein